MTKIIIDIETTGLDSLFDRILCITLYNVESGPVSKYSMSSFVGKDEKQIIESSFNYIRSCKDPELIGFNTCSFDIPFIIRRSIVNELKVPKFKSTDLRKVANGFFYSYNAREKGTLRDWARIMNINVSTENGSEMFKLYADEKFDEIKAHCEEDVKITKALYDRLLNCDLL